MPRVLIPFALCIGTALIATEPTREVISQANLVGNYPIPGFHKGYVYFLGEGRPSQLRLYAPDGHLVLATDIQRSRNFPPDLKGLAVDTDGTIAVSYVDTNNGNRGGIEFLDSTGVRIRVIDTDVWSYLYKGRDEAKLYQPHILGNLLVISFQTQAELLRWAIAADWVRAGQRIDHSAKI